MNPGRLAPWCKRCPLGHSSVRVRVSKDHYVCESCSAYYAGDPIDTREVDTFPMHSSEYEVVGYRGGINNA